MGVSSSGPERFRIVQGGSNQCVIPALTADPSASPTNAGRNPSIKISRSSCSRRGPERNANAYLASTLCNDVRQDAKQPGPCQQQGKPGKGRQQRGVKACVQRVSTHHLVHGKHVRNRNVGVELPNDALNRHRRLQRALLQLFCPGVNPNCSSRLPVLLLSQWNCEMLLLVAQM